VRVGAVYPVFAMALAARDGAVTVCRAMTPDTAAAVFSRPTRVRQATTAYALLIAVIMYLDRVCIAQAAPLIRHDLGLSLVQMGWAFAAFNWAYAIFEVPGGWLGDRIGPRRVLTRVVVWWSFFTAATGWVWNAP
jgi:ACS family glucarate transporter-like MFS transporter